MGLYLARGLHRLGLVQQQNSLGRPRPMVQRVRTCGEVTEPRTVAVAWLTVAHRPTRSFGQGGASMREIRGSRRTWRKEWVSPYRRLTDEATEKGRCAGVHRRRRAHDGWRWVWRHLKLEEEEGVVTGGPNLNKILAVMELIEEGWRQRHHGESLVGGGASRLLAQTHGHRRGRGGCRHRWRWRE
jgi:hypothetical protein